MLARERQRASQGRGAHGICGELARSQAAVFDFLGSMYLERPSAALAERLTTGPRRAARAEPLGHIFLLVGDRGAAARAIARRCQGRDAAALREELAVEHARLFLGPGPGYVAPYESVYLGLGEESLGAGPAGEARGEEPASEAAGSSTPGRAARPGGPAAARPVRLLWREAAVAVEREYRAAGVALVGRREPPDHIGLELQFLAFLCRGEADAWEAGEPAEARAARRRRGEFVAAHLSRWVDDFCEAVERAAGHPFYPGIAKLTRVVVHAEGQVALQAETRPREECEG